MKNISCSLTFITLFAGLFVQRSTDITNSKILAKWLLLFYLSVLCFVNGSAQVKFQKAYGGPGDDNLGTMIKTVDGGYIMAGATFSYSVTSSYEDAYLIKIDKDSKIQWTKTFGGIDLDQAADIVQTPDQGYAVVGSTRSFNDSGIVRAFLVKTDSSGNITWSKTYAITEQEAGMRLKQTEEGGYIMAIETFSVTGSSDVMIIKTDASGNIKWEKAYGSPAYQETPRAIEIVPDGYIIGSKLIDFLDLDMDIGVVKIDTAGNLNWMKRYHSKNWEDFSTMRYKNNKVYIGATVSDSDQTNPDFLLMTIDTAGTFFSARRYGGADNDACMKLEFSSDGNSIYLVGKTHSFGHPPYADAFTIKTDKNGNIKWQKTYGFAADDDIFYTVVPTADGGSIFGGVTAAIGIGGLDFYLVKVDSNGSSGCNDSAATAVFGDLYYTVIDYTGQYNSTIDVKNNPSWTISNGGSSFDQCLDSSIGTGVNNVYKSNSLVIYPNPFTEQFKICLPEGYNQSYNAVIYDDYGREVFNKPVTNDEEISIHDLPSGNYYLRIKLSDAISISKVLVKE